ncbi:hypothetical protein SS50377_25650 [Spironucleus salmonicida]|uniref:Uncharacterized protein n=1 Tax=Spironucleus salmonicida TaxID=348837 RepID=V6LY07_9EUKA|nr:hypothetical protein SS50377_25650 [Spironucleus salmonicida]|eukprot:EST49450.1 Hypothetical protein SS50377_10198 [Spironucleus salmonicida]
MSVSQQICALLSSSQNPLPSCFALAQQAEDDLLLDFLTAIQAKLFATAAQMADQIQGAENVKEWLLVQQKKFKARAGAGNGVDFENILQDVKNVEEKLQKVI